MDSGRVLFESAQRISENGRARIRKGIGEGGDVLLSHKGTVGKVAFVPLDAPQFVCSPQTTFWRVKDLQALDRRYLYYYLNSLDFRRQLDSRKGETDMADYVSLTTQRTLTVTIPPLPEQKAIASILGALDDKIELNRRMNATLEAMARALFQSWFVDFDPVRAKLDGRQPAGLDPATAALFPDSFQDSPLGPIPTGWEAGVLDNLVESVIGGDWGASSATAEEPIECSCIRGADIPSLQEGGLGKMPLRFLKPSSVEKRSLRNGDLAIEISGGSPTQSTGRPTLISDHLLASIGRPVVASNFCRLLKLKSPAYSKFTYLWLRYLYDAGEFFQFENGTTGIKNFAFSLFAAKYPFVIPRLEVAAAFDGAIAPLFARMNSNALESRNLSAVRDSLLPRLLSGELPAIQIGRA